MASRSRHPEPKIVRPDDVDPAHRWDRPLQAPGRTQVDFEERVDFRRLHGYRLARVRAALANSGLGALLSFDQHNIRYTTSTVIGEWARDKLTRYSLLTGNGEPYIWDAGSAARHPKLRAPWLHADHCRAGLPGLRGATGADLTLCRDAAGEIKAILDAEGVGDMPVGVDVVEPPMLFALQKAGIEVRDGQQVMLEAREVKSIDELTLLNMAAAMVDGVYQDIAEALKPGVMESQIVALATKRLYEMGSDCVEAINSISGERCSPHPHNFTDRLIRPGDQAFFDVIQSFMGYRTCYYRTFNVGRATSPQRSAYKKAREWMDRAIELLKPGMTSDKIARAFPEAKEIGFASEMDAFGLNFCHGLGLGLHERPLISRLTSLREPIAKYGAKVVDALPELASRDIVFCMVSTWEDVKEVMQTLLAGSRKPKMVIECSSISLEGSAELRKMLQERAIQYLAAPVSGNAKVIKAGKLTFVVSGPQPAYEVARPYLDMMGVGSSYVGEGELSRIVKICHNVMLGVVTQSLCEITILAQKAGVPRHAFLDFLNKSVMGSMFSRYKTPALVNLDFHVTFTPQLLKKDMDLGLDAGRRFEVPMPLAALTRDLIQQMIGHGMTEQDFSTLLLMQARASGIGLKPENVAVNDGLSS